MTEISLKGWVQNERPWEKETWEKFLKDGMIPFYEKAYKLYAIKKFLEGKLAKYSSISEIPTERKDKVNAAVYGGVKDGKEIEEEKSFARFMYETFGVSVGGDSFEESIAEYSKEGEYSKLTVSDSSYLKKIDLDNIVSQTSSLIKAMVSSLYEKDLNEIFAEKSINIKKYLYEPLAYLPDREKEYEQDELEKLYFEKFVPEPREDASEIVNLFEEFKEKAAKLIAGVNPYMTFAFYIRYIPLEVLCQFLGDEKGRMERAKGVINILRDPSNTYNEHPYETYNMRTLNSVDFPTKRNPYVFLKYERGALSHMINVNEYLLKIERNREIFYDAARKNLESIDESIYEPWPLFEPMFKSVSEHDFSSSDLTVYVYFEKERIKSVAGEDLPSDNFEIKDFVIKLFPLIAAGGISEIKFYSGNLDFYFAEPLKEFAKNIFERHGGM